MGRAEFSKRGLCRLRNNGEKPGNSQKSAGNYSRRQRFKAVCIAEQVYASPWTIHRFFHYDLHMKKISASWVPNYRELRRCNIMSPAHGPFWSMWRRPGKYILPNCYIRWNNGFLFRSSEKKRLDGMVLSLFTTANKCKDQQSRCKIMTKIFWDYAGIMMVDLKNKGIRSMPNTLPLYWRN